MKKIFILILASLAGVLYAWFTLTFGYGVPCIFHVVTGLKCPGCGITHMFIFSIKGDFVSAFYSNPVVFILQPILYYFVGKNIIYYAKDKTAPCSKFENILLYIVIIVILIFTVIRNLFGW